MCGIAGIYRFDGRPVDRAIVKRMGDSIAHRGPDDHRYYFWSPQSGNELYRHAITPGAEAAAGQPVLGFAHRRLAIVDLSGGHQPMTNEDSSAWICYNGEIYNHLALRQSLVDGGHQFQTHSDTEAILHLYEDQGPDSARLLNGIFAFAIWDSQRRRLILARDRHGIKPLYYMVHDGTLIFASEIKAILQVPGVPRIPDPTTIAEHFTFQNHYGDKTFFEGIHLLPGGHWLTCDVGGTVSARPYWQMQFGQTDHRDESTLVEELRVHFENAVTRQLMSEVPLGTFLSGGMDTGSISAVAARAIPSMHTFTCGFNVPHGADSLEQFFDESAASFELASLLRTQHHEVRLDSGHNFPALPWVTWALEEPRLGISYQNWYTSQLIREHVTVVLGGGGGDELFAGYPWRYQPILNEHDPETWNRTYYAQWTRLLTPDRRQTLFSDDLNRRLAGFDTYDSFLSVANRANTTDPLDKALYFDMQTFLHGLLVVEDKLSMAHSIESRVPILDNDLVDFALTLPSSYKLREGTTKYLLKKAMASLLPEETLTRRKQGFTPPDATWYRGPLRGQVEALVLGSRALGRGYFKPDVLSAIVTEHMDGTQNHRFLLWSLMVFEWWNRLFIDGDALPANIPHAATITAS